ncbi:MAG: glycosyltransferase family 2 protein [Flavisolibacter sp.]
MPNPFISICIPAYKRTAFLDRLLRSIKDQTYKEYEVVVSDDSPDDSVKQLINKYTDLNIIYNKNNPAAGTPQNWNIAIHNSKGEWIKLMHDDDWFAQANSLQVFADTITNNKTDFIFSACTYIHEKGTSNLTVLDKNVLKQLQDDHLYLLYDNVIGHPSTTIYRRDVVDYDPHYKWLVDIDFYISYLKKHKTFFYISEPLINIGTGASQVSADCYMNPNVEIPEYLHLISTIGADSKNKYVYYCIWNLVKKFKVKSKEAIQYYYDGPVPEIIKDIISSQHKIPRIILKQTPWSAYFMKKAYKNKEVKK